MALRALQEGVQSWLSGSAAKTKMLAGLGYGSTNVSHYPQPEAPQAVAAAVRTHS